MAGSRKQDVQRQAPARNFATRGIAGLLAPVLRPAFRKRAPAGAAILADWVQLAGPELAARAGPVKFAGGTLTLACTGATAMELQMAATHIIARLNLALGQGLVERLRFVAQAPGIVAVPNAQRANHDSAPPAGLPDGALGAALARLYQGLKTRTEN